MKVEPATKERQCPCGAWILFPLIPKKGTVTECHACREYVFRT